MIGYVNINNLVIKWPYIFLDSYAVIFQRQSLKVIIENLHLISIHLLNKKKTLLYYAVGEMISLNRIMASHGAERHQNDFDIIISCRDPWCERMKSALLNVRLKYNCLRWHAQALRYEKVRFLKV